MAPRKPPPPRKASFPFQPALGSLASNRSVESVIFTVTRQCSGWLAFAATRLASATVASFQPSVWPLSAAHSSARAAEAAPTTPTAAAISRAPPPRDRQPPIVVDVRMPPLLPPDGAPLRATAR